MIQKKSLLPWFIVIADLILAAFGLYQLLHPSVEIIWTTGSEIDTLGYRIYRGDSPNGPFDLLINPELVAASGAALIGGNYRIRDYSVQIGKTYYYLLQEIQLGGGSESFGPITIKAKSLGGLEIATAVAIAIFYLFLNLRRRRISNKDSIRE